MRILKNNTRKNRLIKKLKEENQRLKSPWYSVARAMALVPEMIKLKKLALEKKKPDAGINGMPLSDSIDMLEGLLKDSKDYAEDWGRDYNDYDYVKDAKKVLISLRTKRKEAFATGGVVPLAGSEHGNGEEPVMLINDRAVEYCPKKNGLCRKYSDNSCDICDFNHG